VGKRSVAESPVRKGANLLSSSWLAAAVAPVAIAVTSVVAATRRCHEKGERKGSWCCVVSVRRSGWYPRRRAGVSESRSNEGFRAEIGQGSIPPGFNQTGYKLGPRLNPGESDSGCQTGIRARSRPGWDETSKP
jgi:hypothetical protein